MSFSRKGLPWSSEGFHRNWSNPNHGRTLSEMTLIEYDQSLTGPRITPSRRTLVRHTSSSPMNFNLKTLLPLHPSIKKKLPVSLQMMNDIKFKKTNT